MKYKHRTHAFLSKYFAQKLQERATYVKISSEEIYYIYSFHVENM
jgi:hypothetical protein